MNWRNGSACHAIKTLFEITNEFGFIGMPMGIQYTRIGTYYNSQPMKRGHNKDPFNMVDFYVQLEDPLLKYKKHVGLGDIVTISTCMQMHSHRCKQAIPSYIILYLSTHRNTH